MARVCLDVGLRYGKIVTVRVSLKVGRGSSNGQIKWRVGKWKKSTWMKVGKMARASLKIWWESGRWQSSMDTGRPVWDVTVMCLIGQLKREKAKVTGEIRRKDGRKRRNKNKQWFKKRLYFSSTRTLRQLVKNDVSDSWHCVTCWSCRTRTSQLGTFNILDQKGISSTLQFRLCGITILFNRLSNYTI